MAKTTQSKRFLSKIQSKSLKEPLGKLLAYGAVVGMAVAVLAYLVCFNKTQKQEVLSLLK